MFSLLKSKKIIWTLIIVFLSMIPVARYSALHTGMMDLGINIFHFYNLTSGEWGRVFFSHSQPLYPLYHFLYTQSGGVGPQALLFFQGLAILLPVYWIHGNLGRIVTLAYLLYFPIWFNLLFDFHLDHLSILFISLFFLLIKLNSIGLAVISAIFLALIKEPFALQTAMCGIYLLGAHWNGKLNLKLYLYGFGLIVFGFSYFYFATSYIIPLYSGGESEIGINLKAFSHLGSSISEILWYVLTHPFEILVDVFSTPGKVIYLVALFGALGFVPLLKPGPLIVALPILAISLLSRNEGFYGLGHHYTAGLIAPMIFAFAGGVPKAKLIWRRIGIGRFRLPDNWFIPILIVGLLSVHVALAPSPIGRLFWSDKVWAYSYKAYIPTDRDSMIKQAITDFIPTDPEVVVSIQNTINWAALVQRRHFLLFPEGVVEKVKVPIFTKAQWSQQIEWKMVEADYVVLDENRPWFLIDQSCKWLYGRCTDESMAAKYLEQVEKSRKIMDVVFEEDGFLILKRTDSSL
jgi:uncharacterized membrane protein